MYFPLALLNSKRERLCGAVSSLLPGGIQKARPRHQEGGFYVCVCRDDGGQEWLFTWPPGWETDAAMATASCCRGHRGSKIKSNNTTAAAFIMAIREQPQMHHRRNTVAWRRLSRWGTVRKGNAAEEGKVECWDYILGSLSLPKYPP